MRLMATLTVIAVLIAVMAAGADTDSASAQQVVSRVAAQVEADLAGVGGSGGASPPRGFDPIARAQARMGNWTHLPEPPRIPAGPGPTPGRLIIGGPTAGGMVSEHFARLGTTLTFPASAETAGAIRRMAQGTVSSIPNRCAGTLREALGWGLGDAHQWTALPKRGYHERPRGSAAQPGDIVVWPFSFGRRNSQHVGIAVGTPAGTKLLSNLSGDLGLSSLSPGYRAYWR